MRVLNKEGVTLRRDDKMPRTVCGWLSYCPVLNNEEILCNICPAKTELEKVDYSTALTWWEKAEIATGTGNLKGTPSSKQRKRNEDNKRRRYCNTQRRRNKTRRLRLGTVLSKTGRKNHPM